MKTNKQKLIIEQMDRKFRTVQHLGEVPPPSNGWISATRIALKMSLKQLGKRLGITPQAIRQMELREKTGSISVKGLRDVAHALDMRMVYVFIPEGGSIKTYIEKTAVRVATEIVMRTSQTMKLENQENSKERIAQAVKEKTEELIREMPSYLWD
jgi:predicted DNA-binding mobile mystery protein A